MTKREESTVSVAEAKRHLSDLLGRVAYGKERILIARRGRPMARLVPIGEQAPEPHLADAEGWLDDDDEFFEELERIEESREKHPPRVLSGHG